MCLVECLIFYHTPPLRNPICAQGSQIRLLNLGPI
uniref:Uncharacterized protein n=1 Tax=Anguilla anguilla TaxID=7936 RepID=A0A0E9VG38_ANGAN